MDNFEKKYAVLDAQEGDKILLTDGSVCEFVRAKQKKFIGKMDNKFYDIPFTMFVKFEEKAPVKTATEKVDELRDFLKNIKEGDYFYINQKGNAILYKFVRCDGKKVIGKSPINDITVTIGGGFVFTALK